VLLEVLAQAVILLGKAGRHAESMELLEAAAARFPEASRELEQYFERMRFESALERDDVDLVAEARRFGPHVHKVIGLVKDTPSHLAYEGKVDALRALTAAAWPGIVGDNDHAAAAVLGLLPAWTEMLTARDLVTERGAGDWLRRVMRTARDKLHPASKARVADIAPSLRDTLGVAGGG
jgi:hypothetical protein